MDEELSGGVTNAGAVFRRGDIVDRPAQPHAPAIHRFLGALAEHGFTGAPQPVGLADGREQLTFVAGDVAVSAYPAWSMTEPALASVGALLRRFHDASSAMAARYWVPMLDPETARDFPSYAGLDPVRRLRILADGYRMSAEDRAELVGVVEEVTDVERAAAWDRLRA